MTKVVVFCIFSLIFSGCASTYTPEMVQHIKGSSFKATHTGYYTAELVMKPKQPKVGINKAHLIIHDYEATDIPGLTIKAVPVHTQKGTISNTTPTVKDAGRGLYIIENISLPEPGMWEMQLYIKGEFKNDSVELPIPEVMN
ncbi:MAG: hypothetical protein JSV13_09985 [Nitrospiraceae bacterium]|jgi:hypothetical protein|nr:MAG: hypothetical protein JSV13_09985 [Nitrospiraceae bacterium]